MAKMFFEAVSRAVYAVARITADQQSILGTAFLVGKNLFATAAHVTGADDRDIVILHNGNSSFGEYQKTSERQVQYAAARIYAIDPVRDICILQPVPAGDIFPNYKLASTDLVVPGQMTVTFGFPHADTGRIVLTQQNVQIGAKVMIDTGGMSGKHLVLNTLARPGQSGSPVFDPETVAVVAMIIGAYIAGGGGGGIIGGVNPATLHQTTHAVSAEYITQMISPS